MLSFTELLDARNRSGAPYAEVIRVDALSAGIYELARGSQDPQQPHGEDEIYVVVRGKAQINVGHEVFSTAPGTLVYVAAGVPHRFFDIEEDLAVIVVFAPSEGSAGAGERDRQT